MKKNEINEEKVKKNEISEEKNYDIAMAATAIVTLISLFGAALL